MIAIKINNACGVADSKFFGEAYLPESWLDSDEFSLTEVFFCQINLEDVVKYDEQKLLPDKGYLYFFMDFDCKPVKYRQFTAQRTCGMYNPAIRKRMSYLTVADDFSRKRKTFPGIRKERFVRAEMDNSTAFQKYFYTKQISSVSVRRP